MKTVTTRIVIASLAFFAGQALAQGPALDTDKKKFSYAVGVNIGEDLKQNRLDLDLDVLNQAIADVMKGNEVKMTVDQRQAALQQYQTNKAAENLKKGQEFLAENKKKPGIIQTASGLQYQVVKEGSGKQPKDDDTVVVNYRGTLIDGTEFDSSYRRGQPVTFPVNGVIPGWREVLPLMKEGSTFKVFVPSELAYGPRGAGGDIGPNSTLIFDVELLSIANKTATPQQPQPAAKP